MAKKVTLKVKRVFKSIKASQGDTHKPYINPPKRLRATPKFTVGQLFNLVDERKRKAAKDIAIHKMRTKALDPKTKVIDPSTPTYRIQTYSKHNRHSHNVTVFVESGLPFSKDSKVIVDCSCSSHIFQCEMQLAKRGNAFMWRSNGQTPMVNIKPTICKHTFIALRYMIRQSRYGVLPKKSKLEKKLSFARGI